MNNLYPRSVDIISRFKQDIYTTFYKENIRDLDCNDKTYSLLLELLNPYRNGES